jgi:hypothetical protein
MDGSLNIKNISKFGRSFSLLRIPYSFKLLIQELQAMNIQMRIITDENIDQLLNLSFSNNIGKLLKSNDNDLNRNISKAKIEIKHILTKYQNKYSDKSDKADKIEEINYQEQEQEQQQQQGPRTPSDSPPPSDDNSPPFVPDMSPQGPRTPSDSPPLSHDNSPPFVPDMSPQGPRTPSDSPPLSHDNSPPFVPDMTPQGPRTPSDSPPFVPDFVPQMSSSNQITNKPSILDVEGSNEDKLSDTNTDKLENVNESNQSETKKITL